jgi:hypothetical protein
MMTLGVLCFSAGRMRAVKIGVVEFSWHRPFSTFKGTSLLGILSSFMASSWESMCRRVGGQLIMESNLEPCPICTQVTSNKSGIRGELL